MIMVHKQVKKVDGAIKKQQDEIKKLEAELKALELEQKKQDLSSRVASERFKTKHRNIVSATASFKKGLGVLGREMKKGFSESLKPQKMTRKQQREFDGDY